MLWDSKILKTTQGNGKLVHAHGSEASVRLKFRTIESNLKIQDKIPIKIPGAVLTELEKNTYRIFSGNHKRPGSAKVILKKIKAARIMISDLKVYDKAFLHRATKVNNADSFLFVNAGKLANGPFRQVLPPRCPRVFLFSRMSLLRGLIVLSSSNAMQLPKILFKIVCFHHFVLFSL